MFTNNGTRQWQIVYNRKIPFVQRISNPTYGCHEWSFSDHHGGVWNVACHELTEMDSWFAHAASFIQKEHIKDVEKEQWKNKK